MSKSDKYIPVYKQLSRGILAITVITTTIVAILVMALSTYEIQKMSNAYYMNELYGANESIEKRLGKIGSARFRPTASTDILGEWIYDSMRFPPSPRKT